MEQRRAHSSSKEDGIEEYKILGQKDEVDKSRATRDLQVPWLWYYRKDEVDKSRIGWVIIKPTWLDHVQSVICRSCNHDITIAFPLWRELRQTCRYECSLVKNLPTHWETGKENREINENILAP